MKSLPWHALFFGRALGLVGGVALCLAVGVVVRHAHILAVACGCGLLLGCVWPWFTIRMTSASAGVGELRCRPGERVDIQLRLRNRFFLALPAVDILLPAALLSAGDTETFDLPPGLVRRPLGACAPRRGVVPLSELRIGCGFPFGLWHVQRPVVSPDRLIFWPRVEPVATLPLAGLARPLPVGMALAGVAARGEVAGVRAYRRGDSMRDIQWQQTARHDRLIVRERAGGERRSILLVLDTRGRSYSDAAIFERAVSLAAGVVDRAGRDGLLVALQAGGVRLEASIFGGHAKLMDALAGVEPDDEIAPDAPMGLFGVLVTTSAGLSTLGAPGLLPLLADQIGAFSSAEAWR